MTAMLKPKAILANVTIPLLRPVSTERVAPSVRIQMIRRTSGHVDARGGAVGVEIVLATGCLAKGLRLALRLEVAEETIGVVADEREEARADRHGHAPAEGDDGAHERCEDEGHPAVDAPVVNGHEDSLLGTLRIRGDGDLLDVIVIRSHVAFRASILTVEVEWLGNAEIIEAGGDAAREKERDPGEVAEARALILPSETEFSKLGDETYHKENDAPHVQSADVEPREVLSGPRFCQSKIDADIAIFAICDTPDTEAPEDDDSE
eukprot:scaffold129050_cov35-Tisochrysis_lutea.AAC.1